MDFQWKGKIFFPHEQCFFRYGKPLVKRAKVHLGKTNQYGRTIYAYPTPDYIYIFNVLK